MKQGNKTKYPRQWKRKKTGENKTYREENCPLLKKNLVCFEA